jgi:hypothetical protein
MTSAFLIACLACAATVIVAGCQAVPSDTARANTIQYLGVQTKLLTPDLVQFHVTLTGADTAQAVETYAKCAAAQYTLIRGFGFARHVRTQVGQDGPRWNADAVYTVSGGLPNGLRTLDAEVVADSCKLNEIPMV